MACLAAATSKHTIDFEFTPVQAHMVANDLRKMIQSAIDSAEDAGGYDAIILGFGLCGNSTEGLTSKKLRLVIPRAHDCCAIFLGSVGKYIEQFKDRPSQGWGCHGYIDRDMDQLKDTEFSKSLGLDVDFQTLVTKFGKENAKMLWESLHPFMPGQKHVYIKVEPFENLGFMERFMEKKRAEDDEIGAERGFEILDGSMSFMSKLVNGDWDEEFLIIEPGQTIEPKYNLAEVFVAVDAGARDI